MRGHHGASAETPSHGVLHCAPDGSVLSVDRGLAAMLGYPSWRDVTRRVLSILELYADPADRRRLFGRLESGLPGDEARWLRSDGTSLWVRTRVREVQDWESGECVLEVDVEEVTERHHVEEQLRRLQRMEAVGALAAGMAHDFNNQLTTILGHLELIEMELAGLGASGERIRRESEEIRAAARRGACMAERLRGLSGRQRIEIRPLHLDQLVVEVRRLVGRLLPPGIDLRLVNMEPVPVLADPGAVEQMLLALVSNARDAMGDRGLVTLETGRSEMTGEECSRRGWGVPGSYGCLVVSDTGPGIPAEVLERGFDPVAEGRHGGGMGLGLPVVYGLMKQHQGFVEVESIPGEGATIRLLFPLEGVGGGGTPGHRPLPPGEPCTILVADDDPQVRRAAGRLLASRGFRIIEAVSGEDALQIAAESGEVDLLLADLVMPGMGGVELARRMALSGRARQVVFTAGYSDPDLAGREGIPDDALLLNKPWTAEVLLRTVRAALDREPEPMGPVPPAT